MYNIEQTGVDQILQILDLLHIRYKISGQYIKYYVNNISSLNDPNELSLVFVSTDLHDQITQIKNTPAKVVICSKQLVLESIKTKVLIKVDNPKLVFAKIANSILSRKQKYGFHATSVIHPDAKIHRNCYIGPHAYIGRAEIGEGTIIYGNCYIYDNVSIGKRVIIDAGCVIGSEGFGFVRDEDGIPVRFPQIGGVLIEDDVEIGANTCIDRGALNNTIIHQGVKIDKLVHIAHNVEIGKYSFIISNSVIAGSSRIGDFCWISPTTTVINKVNIGNRAVIGIGSVVTKNVPDDQTWMGNPAVPIEKFIKTLNKLKTL